MNYGGPAFPRPTVVVPGMKTIDFGAQGMTLRDYFAAQAMQAILSRTDGPPPCDAHDRISRWSYGVADVMLKVREEVV